MKLIDVKNYDELFSNLSGYNLSKMFDPESRSMDFMNQNETLSIRCADAQVHISYFSSDPELSKDTLKDGPNPLNNWYKAVKKLEIEGNFSQLPYFKEETNLENAIKLGSHLCKKMVNNKRS